MEKEESNKRIVIVSNRLPFNIETDDNQPIVRPSSGGLITALAPLLKDKGCLWIGWPGGLGYDEATLVKLTHEAEQQTGLLFKPVFLTKEEIDLFYYGFSNEVIWPLFHDLQTKCCFVPEYWKGYQQVNTKFAQAVLSDADPNDFIWVHDYQLLLVGQEIRKQNPSVRTGFFLHIPFPPLDIFIKLPWRLQIIDALLDFDFLGFQTQRDCRNFVHCVKLLRKNLPWKNKGAYHLCKKDQREICVGAFPIGIDYEAFSKEAFGKEIAQAAWLLHEKWPNQKLILSIDRLDYTKGILERLAGIHYFLKKHPEMHKQICFVQMIIPSRIEIPGYQSFKQEIDRLVSEINSQFTHESWVPIHYQFSNLSHIDLLAYYRTSDVVLVTSLKDGMNLVSKEYVACQVEKTGVVILSEFAGSAVQLQHGALLVHPYDVEGVGEAIYKALNMPMEERKKRMSTMRRNVKRYDVFWWMHQFLNLSLSQKMPSKTIKNDIAVSIIPEMEC